MQHWITVLRFEVAQQFRRKAYLFLTFGVPLLVVVGFSVYRTAQDTLFRVRSSEGVIETLRGEENDETDANIIGYVDLTPARLFPAPTSYPDRLSDCRPPEVSSIEEITAADVKRLTLPVCFSRSISAYPSVEAGSEALKRGEIDAFFAVEPDYLATGRVSQYFSEFGFNLLSESLLFQDYLLASLLYRVPPDDYFRLYMRLREPAVIEEGTPLSASAVTTAGETDTSVTFDLRQDGDSDRNIFIAYVFSLAMGFSLLWGGGYLMQTVVQDKENRIIEILLSSARPLALLVGKIIANSLLSLLQVATLGGAALVILNQAGTVSDSLQGIEIAPFSLVLMVVYWLLGFLLFGSLMSAVGAVSTTLRESQNLAIVVTIPAVLPFFFQAVIADNPGSSLATTLSVVPLTAPLSMIMRLSVADVPTMQIVLSLALLATTAAFAIWFCARLFRVNTLLMGKMPGLKDLPTLLRG